MPSISTCIMVISPAPPAGTTPTKAEHPLITGFRRLLKSPNRRPLWPGLKTNARNHLERARRAGARNCQNEQQTAQA